MLKQRPIQLLITILPLFILLIMSGYLSIKYFVEYRTNQQTNNILENVEQLKNYETAILKESICMALISPHAEGKFKLCKDRSLDSHRYFRNIQDSDENLEHWEQEISTIKENVTKKSIDDFENILGSRGVISTVGSYIDASELDTRQSDEKELLKIYKYLSDVMYATELENFLLTYYVTKKIPISTFNVIFWDKIVESSYLRNFDDVMGMTSVKEKLLKISTNDAFQKTLAKVDNMRITILTGRMLETNENFDWIVLLENKLDSLNAMKSIVYDTLIENNEKYIDNTLWAFLFYVSIIVLVLFSLIYNYYRIQKEINENAALLSVVHRINALSAYGTTESDVMSKMLTSAKSKEDILAYIYSSFQLLDEKSRQAKDNAESKSQFLSTLSHEIRTPLNGIIGFSKLLKDMGTTADQEEFLSLIEGSSHKLIMIVNDILDLSKMNADKMEIEDVSFNIFDMVESTVATFTHETDQKDIELGIFIDPFLSHYFLGDATKLSQILTNLIGNSVKFTNPYGKINIFVQSLHNSKDEAQIKFAINDDGIGLSEEQIKNIFNAFSQATKSTSSQYGGTGLGLTISRKMVELMGGKLEVESKTKEGASFYFTLTLKKDNTKTYEAYPDFTDVSIGLALPVKNIKRQLDTNLAIYIKHLGAEFSLYYYEDLFESDKIINLPDIMIFDHHYARLPGELEQCTSLDCKAVLLTNGTLRSRINPERHNFSDVLFTPISIRKCIRILNTNKIENQVEKTVYKKQTKILESIESFSGIHALVADDNLINRKLIKIILEKLGLKVSLVSNGKEACIAYKRTSYDIVFMDIQMPVMDGVEATHCILDYENKNGLSHVPIIALTANVATGDKDRYISEGMDDYTTKPLEIDTIKSIISLHCNSRTASEDKVK